MVMRHVWEEYLEKCKDIRHTIGMKELYRHRKETIERLFGTAKEKHGFRYTQMIGKARMEMNVGLTFAYMNLKKLVKMKQRLGILERNLSRLLTQFQRILYYQRELVPGLAS